MVNPASPATHHHTSSKVHGGQDGGSGGCDHVDDDVEVHHETQVETRVSTVSGPGDQAAV